MHENINNGRIAFTDPNARRGNVTLPDFLQDLIA